jgi:hypothetical protein
LANPGVEWRRRVDALSCLLGNPGRDLGAGAHPEPAVETLQQLGYTDVAHLGGGFTAWTRAGREVLPG